jgi:hypothetical protein
VPHTLRITDEQAVYVENLIAMELTEVSTGMSTYIPDQHQALANVLRSMNPENDALEMFDGYVDTLSEEKRKQAQRRTWLSGYGDGSPTEN